ncbi:MAG: hypothetical protein NC909_01765 [Candidatus Omnitrophica bacterium]|nr:hypothetical protein [Candidatus Omnitrophota bacterium]
MRRLFICMIGGGFILLGCAGTKETVKGFLGISTKILQDKRAEAKVLVLNYDYFTTYHKVMDKLKENGSFIYKKTADLIAFYVSEENTTPVGVFFKELEKQKTMLEISSPSSVAKEDILNLLSSLNE